jgi:hypothetical protein
MDWENTGITINIALYLEKDMEGANGSWRKDCCLRTIMSYEGNENISL